MRGNILIFLPAHAREGAEGGKGALLILVRRRRAPPSVLRTASLATQGKQKQRSPLKTMRLPVSTFVHQHYTIAEREQGCVDAQVGVDFRIQRPNRVGVGIVVVRIGDAT